MLRTSLLLLSLFLALSPAYAAESALTVGEEVAGTLPAGGQATYSLELGPQYIVYGAAIQKSVDVIITVSGPDGTEVGVFDVSGEGPDYFDFRSTVEGSYGITIAPFEDGAGEFSVLLYMAEKLAEDPAGKIDQMMMRYNNDVTPGAIVPTADLEFNIVVADAAINFHRDDEGNVSSLTLHQGGGLTGHRLTTEAWAPEAEELAPYAGRYFSAELEAFYEIVFSEDALVLQHRRFKDVKLKARKMDVFGAAAPLGEVAFVRNGEGALTGFMASNGRTRGILFEKVD